MLVIHPTCKPPDAISHSRAARSLDPSSRRLSLPNKLLLAPALHCQPIGVLHEVFVAGRNRSSEVRDIKPRGQHLTGIAGSAGAKEGRGRKMGEGETKEDRSD